MSTIDAAALARLSEATGEPGWLADRRRAAFERFEALPWPDQSREEWRHTDIRALDAGAFDPLAGADAPEPAPEDGLAGAGSQVDGGALSGWLDPALEAQGVVFSSLARAAAEHPELVKTWLGRGGVSEHEQKIASLNAAFWSGATFLYVPRGIQVALPVRTRRRIERAGVAVFPQTVLVADEGSSVTYIDEYRSDDPAEALSVAAVEIYAEQGANVSYLALQDWAQSVWHFNVQRAVVGRDATVRSLAASIGARLSRSVVESVLDGQGAHAEMLGVYFGDHDQHIDNRTLQRHSAPHTSSDLYYKGALKGRSRAVYSGLVDIEKEGTMADARQANRNLLLSEGASADPSPFLEIKTSEVARATHGVSVGRPSAEVLFYLHSRGIDQQAAVNLYVKGFFQEVIDRVSVPEVRDALEAAVEAELAEEDE